MRVAKYIAMHSNLSRRDAEEVMRQGRVFYKGRPLESWTIGEETSPEHFTIDGNPLAPLPKTMLWAYHKPTYCLVTRHDPQGRETIFDLLPESMRRGPLVAVGRLDYLSEGLLLITNRPGLAHLLETSDLPRCYRVEVKGRIIHEVLQGLELGCCLDGVHYAPCSIVLQQFTSAGAILEITLQEGKNREIRHLMKAAGLYVVTLMRLSFGNFFLGKLMVNGVKTLPLEALSKTILKRL